MRLIGPFFFFPQPDLKNHDGNEQDTSADHNYQAKPVSIDLEASCSPKFVYYLVDNNQREGSSLEEIDMRNEAESN